MNSDLNIQRYCALRGRYTHLAIPLPGLVIHSPSIPFITDFIYERVFPTSAETVPKETDFCSVTCCCLDLYMYLIILFAFGMTIIKANDAFKWCLSCD